jgi:hypothetical protein
MELLTHGNDDLEHGVDVHRRDLGMGCERQVR